MIVDGVYQADNGKWFARNLAGGHSLTRGPFDTEAAAAASYEDAQQRIAGKD